MSFSEQECKTALERVFIENTLSKRSTGFVFNVNDCFSLFYRYDKKLRGQSKLKDKITSYTSNMSFMRQLLKHYKGSLEDLCKDSGFIIVDTPVVGDVAFINDMQNSITVVIKADKDLWYASSMVRGHDKLSDSIVFDRLVFITRPVKES